MTISAQELYSAYCDEVGWKNHDGTFKLPKHVSKLGEAQQRAWQAAATLANLRMGEMATKTRSTERTRIKEAVNCVIDSGLYYRSSTGTIS